MSKKPQSSTAAQPDLDWSQVKETVLMLKLAAAQVDFSLKEGNSSVNVLTDSFTGMAGSIKTVGEATESIFEKYQVAEADKADLKESCKLVANKMQQAIVAFQFYDTLVQRMDHVVDSLSGLSDLVGDSDKLYSPYEWRALQQRIRSGYSMEKERELFDAIIAGDDMRQVLGRMQQIARAEDDDIELF